MLKARDIGHIMQAMDIGSGVPGRTRGELIAFQQDSLSPAELGQMIQNRATNNPAPDDYGLCICSHETCSFTP